MAADKDWTTPAARAELLAMHADAAKGELSAEVRKQLINGLANAVPALLARIERDEALLRRASLAATALIEGEHDLACCENAVEALRDDLQAAGFAPEEEQMMAADRHSGSATLYAVVCSDGLVRQRPDGLPVALTAERAARMALASRESNCDGGDDCRCCPCDGEVSGHNVVNFTVSRGR